MDIRPKDIVQIPRVLKLATNLLVKQRGIPSENELLRFRYSNPFWTDSLPPDQDEAILVLRSSISELKAQRRSNRIPQFVNLVCVLGLSLSLEQQTQFGIEASLAVIVVALIYALVLRGKVRSKKSKVRQSLHAVCRTSIERYENWKSDLLESDRDFFVQITMWHQGEDMKDIKTRQLITQQKQLTLQTLSALDSAQTNSAIRGHLRRNN